MTDGQLQTEAARRHPALALLDPADSDPESADLLRLFTSLDGESTDASRAEWRYFEDYTRAHRTGYIDGMAEAANRLGLVAMGRGELYEAETRFQLARRLAWEAGNERLAGSIEQSLGSLARVRGEFETAVTHQRKALAQFRVAGDEGLLGLALNNLGRLHAQSGEWKEAEEAYGQALEVAHRASNLVLENSIRVNVAELHLSRGDLDAASDACGEARALAQQRNDVIREAEALKVRGVILR
jgi:tetratricopeptide (TPR) repeat protein